MIGYAYNIHDFWLPVCKRACFVKGDYFYICEPLQRIPLAHQKAVFCGVSDGGHDCGRGSQHQSTGAKYHQNGYGTYDLPCDKPSDGCGTQGDHNDPGCPTIGKPYNFGFSCICTLHQTDHTLNRTVLTHLCGFHLKSAELIHCAAGHFVPHCLVYGQ